MNDLKNFYFAWVASIPFLATIHAGTLITFFSAIIVPVLCFLLGKAIDVAVQFYLQKERQKHDR
jgi:hypothetical protein